MTTDWLKWIRFTPKVLSDDQKESRGAKAKALLNSAEFMDTFDERRSILLKTIVESAYSDTELRENCYFALKALEDTEVGLRIYVENGQFLDLTKDD